VSPYCSTRRADAALIYERASSTVNPDGRRAKVRKLTIFVLINLLIASSSASMAKQRKVTHKPAYGSGVTVEPTLLPEAARMKEMQKYWPNQPLCDEGGYRIQPCLFSPGRG
jgi:hypothetical protein